MMESVVRIDFEGRSAFSEPDDGVIRIGSRADCAFRDDRFPPVLAEIRHLGAWVVSTSSSGARLVHNDAVAGDELVLRQGQRAAVEWPGGQDIFVRIVAATDVPKHAPRPAVPNPVPSPSLATPAPSSTGRASSSRATPQAPLGGSELLVVGRIGGRANIQLEGDDVALRHAELTATSNGFRVRDLGSSAGTFVNGEPVLLSPVGPNDVLLIGHHMVTFDEVVEWFIRPGARTSTAIVPQPRGEFTLRIAHLDVSHGSDSPLTLTDVSLAVSPGSLVALIGPSGAGKSTLFSAILGELAVRNGSIQLGRLTIDPGAAFPAQLISFVPQSVSVIGSLTVRKNLYYAALFKMSSDVPKIKVEQAVDEVLHKVDLTGVEGNRSSRLSGGQQRRLSIAMELLSRPALLLLDEPTSGLDAHLAHQLMDDLTDFARGDHVVMAVIHEVENALSADQVVALTKRPGQVPGQETATVGYAGHPTQLFAAFGVSSPHELMRGLHQGEMSSGMPAVIPASAPPKARAAKPRRLTGAARTLHVSVRRELARMASQPVFTAVSTIILPVMMALLCRGLNSLGFAASTTDPNLNLFMSVTMATVLVSVVAAGTSLLAVAGDMDVISREIRWGVGGPAVILSRFVTRSLITLTQSVVFVVLFFGMTPVPENRLDGGLPLLHVWLLIALLAVACTALGILMGVLGVKVERTVVLFSGVVALLVILNGAIIPLHDKVVFNVISFFLPTRWAVMALVNFLRGTDFGITSGDELLQPSWAHYWMASGALILLMLVFLLISLGVFRLAVTRHRRR